MLAVLPFGLGPVEFIIILVLVIVLFLPSLLPRILKRFSDSVTTLREMTAEKEAGGDDEPDEIVRKSSKK